MAKDPWQANLTSLPFWNMPEENLLLLFFQVVKGEWSLPDCKNYSNQHLVVDFREQLKIECQGKQGSEIGTTE